MSDVDATMKAIQDTKNATAMVDPARNMRYFNPESNIAGGQMAILGKQYHQIPMKLIEQFSHAAADFKANPAKATRYVAGSTIAAAGAAAGLHTLHVNPLDSAKYLAGGWGQVGSVGLQVMKNLAKGDVASALGNIAAWVAPGGGTLKKAIK
jgi:hypothetical protein